MAKDKIADIDLLFIDEPTVVDRMEISTEAITELAASISEIGLLQPILLRQTGERYEVIAGHRRFLAHKLLGRRYIKSIIRAMTDEEAALARATENLSRVDLTPIEEANVYFNLINAHGMTADQVGKKFGKSPGLIKRRMDLLKMPPQLQKAVHEKKIAISVAEELWPITDVATLDYYLSFALDGGCTQAVARQWCKDWRDTERRKIPGAVGGGEVGSPFEPRPCYLPCDLCHGPVELGTDKMLRICPECHNNMLNAMKGV
uniref:ParB-like N-terminal domain-containing protein n=1 Tax=viral metagenome TaxID=1070528 RepID=A0A6M3LMD7_9ZZZZ